jgi:acyl transferase domain-containing protein/acyl carrier protein
VLPILVVTPSHELSAPLAIAAARAGGIGILDLGYGFAAAEQQAAFDLLSAQVRPGNQWGIRWDTLGTESVELPALAQVLGTRSSPILLLAGATVIGPLNSGSLNTGSLGKLLEAGKRFADLVVLEVCSVAEVTAAAEAGFDAVLVKGNEAAGRVSADSAFELIEQLRSSHTTGDAPKIPLWIEGGMGPDTATAALLAGATGVVLREQVWLTTESPFDEADRRRWSQLDGTETFVIGSADRSFRLYSPRGRESVASVADSLASGQDWQVPLRSLLLEGDEATGESLIPLGREIGQARRLADDHVNVAGIVQAYRLRIEENLKIARTARAVAPEAALAEGQGTRYPILQLVHNSEDSLLAGETIAERGGLPVFSLHDQGAAAARAVLAAAKDRLAERPWGVSLLGSADAEVRDQQLAELRNLKPSVVLLDGSLASVATELESLGVVAYLRVTSPNQLSSALAAGTRKFIVAGSDVAGGDAKGPRVDLALWQAAVSQLAGAKADRAEEFHVVFALGHGCSLSAAMVAALAAPVSARGMKIGLLVGDEQSDAQQAASAAIELHEISSGGAKLLEQLASRRFPWQPDPEVLATKSADIAVVGMACMFPQANTLREYWENIVNRVDAVEVVPADRWNADDYFDEDSFAEDKVYSKWGGFLGSMVFDPMKWRIPPASLLSIEPLQLLALEVASKAMQDAGYDRRDFPREKSGVLFACAGSHELGTSYSFRTMMRNYLPMAEGLSDEAREKLYASLETKLPEWTEDSFPGFLLNVVAGRIAREFNFNGPNYVVDAACAASLAALHAAIEQLRSGTSDMMLVGGADATNNPFCYMCFSKTHALSPHGRSRPFDDAGDGIGLGEGIACVVLKRLADAERDGDKIYAVIKGIGASSDGKNRSLTAPHPPGQARAVRRAYEDAQLSPATVSLVEAHGTGTVVGDSAELTTLTEVFSRHSDQRQFVGVGSVKSMIGHTKTVAGMASLIKIVLALRHGVLPPTIGVDTPTRRVDFRQTPFYINTETRPWIGELGDEPRRAGVSAFGFGGTNFHVVLEEYTGSYHAAQADDLTPRAAELFVWRRDSREQILDAVRQLHEQLTNEPAAKLAPLGAAVLRDEAARERPSSACRLAIVATSTSELKQRLGRALQMLPERKALSDPSGIYYSEASPVQPEQVCFLYPGQGSQSVNMLRDLLVGCPWGRELLTDANRWLEGFLPEPLSRYIYPRPVFDEAESQRLFAALSDTRVAQPALGAVELFATELLDRFGLRPGFVAGHSYGEHVALYAAGCLSREDLLRLSAIRGQVCAEAARDIPGGMVAVQADALKTQAALKELEIDATLANLNAPDQTIIAGAEAVIATAVDKLTKMGLRAKRIAVSAAFHSPLLHRSAEKMAVHFRAAEFHTPKLPVYSNTTGGRHSQDPDDIRQLLARHFDEPVLWEQEVRQLYRDGAQVFLEVGPGKVLSGLVSRILQGEPVTTLAIDAPGREGFTQLAHVLGQLLVLGLPVEMGAWYGGRGLATTSVSEYFAQVHRETHPKPSDWIIGPMKCTPITPLPVRTGARKGEGLRAKFGAKSGSTAPATVASQPGRATAIIREASGSDNWSPEKAVTRTPQAQPQQSQASQISGVSAAASGSATPLPGNLAAPIAVRNAVPNAVPIAAPAASIAVPVTPLPAPPVPIAAQQVPIAASGGVVTQQPVPMGTAGTAANHVNRSFSNGAGVSISTGGTSLGGRESLISREALPSGAMSGQNRFLVSTPVSSSRKTVAMTSTSGEANGNVPPSVVSATGSAADGAGLYADFQATTRMLLEVQFSQQRLVERFLDTQERMLLHCLTGGASAVPALPASAPLTLSVAAPSTPTVVAPAYVPQPAVQHAVAQQPVLQQPAVQQPLAPPSAFGSASARVAPSGVVARPPVAVPAGSPPPQPAQVVPTAVPAAVARPAAVAAPAPVAAPTANGHAHNVGTNGAGTNGAVASNGSAVATNGQANAVAKSTAPAAPAAGGPPSVEQFREDLLAIVSERTGYPTDMLDVDLPLEAGLGIDSIKTVEIFSSLKTYHVYFADEGQDEEERLTEFTKLKTLGDIIDSYARRQAVHAAGGGATAAPSTNGEAAKSSGEAAASTVDRYSLTAVEAPLEAGGSKKNFQSIT